MNHIRKTVGCLVLGGVMSLVFLVTTVQAQSGNLEPPGSAVGGSGVPVPTTQTQPSWDQNGFGRERFKRVLSGQAFLDITTGLVWEITVGDTNGDSIITDADRVIWDDARRFCLRQNDGGVGGWRLPSVHELRSLYAPNNPNGNPDLPFDHPFLLVQSADYWSATRDAGDNSDVWFVNFGNGSLDTRHPFIILIGDPAFPFAWCVRGGGPLSEY